MLLLIAFLLTALVAAFYLSRYFKFIDGIFERLAFTVIFGLTFSAYVAFGISYLLGRLDETALMGAIFLNLMIAGSSIRNFGAKLDKKELILGKISIWEILVILVFLMLVFFNSMSLATDSNGNITSIANAWADYAFHVSIINSFALRDNFPPIYPNLASEPMRYPFMADFLSAIMVKEGVSIDFAITIPNFLLIFSLVTLAYAFMRKLFSSKQVAALAILLFFLNGNYGFINFFSDFFAAGDKAAFLAKLPQAYSYLPDSGANIVFMNLTYSVFIPQRATLMGFPLVCLIFIILLRIFEKEAENREFFLLGLLTAMLPLVHASSFAVAGIVALFVFFAATIREGTIEPKWFLYGIPIVVFAIPQLLFISQQSIGLTFLGPQIGWMSRATNYQEFIAFWFRNAGLVLALGLVALPWLKKEHIVFAMPAFAIFLLCNVMRLQPWEWDNVKLLMYWYFIMCGFSAFFLYKLYETSKKGAKIVGAFIMVALTIICIFSGLLTMLFWSGSSAVLWSASDIKMANFIAQNTERNAIFLTATNHNNIAYTLGGRQILAGYDGHLWSHGLSYSQQYADARLIFANGDLNAIKRWNIEYIMIGPEEISKWGANPQVFLGKPVFEQIKTPQDGKVWLFRVLKDPESK